ncbi:DUF423 domain-containing protein [Stieleria varia]|uniref:DUF423 domain-containing protein n=1 Tax=Stieleria varia TaxID=2528005 RepID=A0A5C6B970_9BACT|nr:DUF423 domain-containing protein [Stieleria varia]TWU07859.1 hypothetical protein Pla52n_04350 [Stieleria varia]
MSELSANTRLQAVTRLQARLIGAAGITGALGVLIGAFGAHGLEGYLVGMGLDAELIAKRMDQFDVGARYHLIHGVALLGLAVAAPIVPSLARWSAWLMLIGLVLFSGSLYILVATNTPWLGAITPLGGLSWIVGWAILAAAPWVAKRDHA